MWLKPRLKSSTTGEKWVLTESGYNGDWLACYTRLRNGEIEARLGSPINKPRGEERGEGGFRQFLTKWKS